MTSERFQVASLPSPQSSTATLDGDLIPNFLDPDNDNDGTPDSADTDDDNDGILDMSDPDDDNDGIHDVCVNIDVNGDNKGDYNGLAQRRANRSRCRHARWRPWHT